MTGDNLNSPAEAKTRFYYGYVIVAICFLLTVMTLGAYFSVGIFLKPITAELGWSRGLISGAFATTWIVSGLLSIAIGGLNDRFGPRIVLTVCVLLSGLGYILMSQVSAVWQLYLFYGLLIGTGIASYVPISATVIRWFVKRRTLMIGIVAAGGGIGALVGPPVANQLILAFDWRLAYIIIGITYLLVSLVASQFLKRDPAAIGKTAYGADETAGDINYSEARSLSVREVAGTSQFWLVLMAQICVGIVIHVIFVHIAPHVTDLGISTTSAANTLAIIGISNVAGEIVLGNAGDRIGNKKVLAISIILMLAAYLWLLNSNDIWQFYLFAAVFGLGVGGCVAQQAPLVARLFGTSSYGVVLALISMGFTTGAAVGPALAGYIFDITTGYQFAFLGAVCIAIIGLILTLLLKPLISGSADKSSK
ncbi:MFS transporter [Chloroflexota bacterium]